MFCIIGNRKYNPNNIYKHITQLTNAESSALIECRLLVSRAKRHLVEAEGEKGIRAMIFLRACIVFAFPLVIISL